MTPDKIHLGAVLQPDWDERPIRVLAFDEEQVMYDCWWPHVPGWGITSLRSRISYYRTSTSLIRAKAEYLRTDQYSDAERNTHRPDLPFSFGCVDSLDWPECGLGNYEESLSSISKHLSVGPSERLNVRSVYLSPFGPKGSPKAGIRIDADDGIGFGVAELLWQAAKIQSQYLRDVKITSGIGIHRLGIQGGIPSYYIWGAADRMGRTRQSTT